MTAPLRSPPDGDPRPRRLDMNVVLLAVKRHTEITEWAKRRQYEGDDEDFAAVALAEAIEHADGDLEKAIKALQVLHKWEPDFSLRNHAASAIKHLPECWRYMMLRWVVRTGMRFPARIGDLILFDDGEHQRKGRVVEKDLLVATANVEGENGRTGAVMAERVLANITSSNYGHMRVVALPRITLPDLSALVSRPCDTE